jgi:hypothetical protein
VSVAVNSSKLTTKVNRKEGIVDREGILEYKFTCKIMIEKKFRKNY